MRKDGKAVSKGNLPEKTCPACGRPFAWRRKWARVWHEVVYCSERCRRVGDKPRRKAAPAAKG